MRILGWLALIWAGLLLLRTVELIDVPWWIMLLPLLTPSFLFMFYVMLIAATGIELFTTKRKHRK